VFYRDDGLFSFGKLKQTVISNPKTIHKILNIVKLILVAVTFGFLYYKLVHAYHLNQLVHTFDFQLKNSDVNILLVAFVLAAVNIMLESSKWRLLVNRFESVSFKQAIKAVCAGMTLSIITPNQIGDFAGRVLYIRKMGKLNGALVTVIGHTAQVLITVAFGLMSYIWFAGEQNIIRAEQITLYYIALLILVALSIYAYLNLKQLQPWIQKSRFKRYLEVFYGYSRGELLEILIMAFLRWTVVNIEFILLVHFFDIDVSTREVFACVNATLLVQTLVPSFILLDLGIRGASALWFFGAFTNQPDSVLLMTYSIWVINIFAPGMLGLYYLLRWKPEA
jgi:hypothetical protein